jgi:hypothetical protein
MKRIASLVVVLAALTACESVGIGVGIGIPIGSRGGAGITIDGSVPLPGRSAEPAASAPSAPLR